MDLLLNQEDMVYATQASYAENASWEGKGNASAVRGGKIVTMSITDEENTKDDNWKERESISHAEEEESHWVKFQRGHGDWVWDREEDEGEWVDGSSDEEEDGRVEMHKVVEGDESYEREGGVEIAQHEPAANSYGYPGFPSDADEGSDKWIYSIGSSVVPLAEGSSVDGNGRATAQIDADTTAPYTRVNVSVLTGYGLGRLVRVIDEVLRTRGG